MLNRRALLGAGGVTGAGALLTMIARMDGASARPAHHHGTAPASGPPLRTEPFAVRMPVPEVLRPKRSNHGGDLYELDIRPAEVEIVPGLRTPVLTYGGTFVGPTIRARRGRHALVRFRNTMGADANVHLHGGHVPPHSDGYPTDVIPHGGQRVYHYPNSQQGATLWYHDHTHHREAEHVYRGLHGFYLLEDEDERALRLPGGPYDVPVMLSDAHLDASGALVWNPFGGWFERTTLLANGRPQPYFPVEARRYRFRLLNAATHRHFRLDLDGEQMVQIASDGGLLPRPVALTELVLSPGERAEVIVDFGRHRPGTRLVLSDVSGPVLRFDVERHARDDSRVPDELRPAPAPLRSSVERHLVLSTDLAEVRSLINGRVFDADRVDFRIRHGATETWRISNADTDPVAGHVDHNFHIHLVQFRVLDRDGRPPRPGEEGWKDTVVVPPGESVRVQATFRGYRGRYVHHCHILEHSQFGMMGQFEVV
ncbi:multicopper oxidase domain-containing protein [Saccharothrix sp.]|uniref:multicopper oxidase family protein n=1 Tax=Saccharothrix sp. TaxID=1873460 RepID=UPI002811413A|nr:multicopper oxidase domain-containing protein [Saccharothrix sp.]